MTAAAFGLVAAAGVAAIATSWLLRTWHPRAQVAPEGRRDLVGAATARSAKTAPGTLTEVAVGTNGTLRIARVVVGAGGAFGGYAATGLWGMALLGAGLGVLGPPFATAPARRRRHTAVALAWQAWARQLAELARSGAGLADALAASVPHADPRIAPAVERTALVARHRGIIAAAEQLASAGGMWEPDIAAGLRMAAAAGGPVASSLDALASRIGDSVAVHRARTEAVVALWTQTIALLGLAGGVITLMYRNNPAYFEPYRTPNGQTVLTVIAMVLLGATAFLVRHSTVRAQRSPLAPTRRERRHTQRPPL